MSKKRGGFKAIFNIILLFMFVFDIALLSLPTLFSTRKIAFLILLIEAFMGKIVMSSYDFKIIKKLIIGVLIVFGYTLFISALQGSINNSGSVIPRFAYFILYTLFGSVLIINHYKDEYSLMKDTISVMWIQSIIIFLEFYSSSFKQFLTKYFVNEGNIDFLRTDRGTGLGAEAGYLTLLLFVGVFCCNYLMITHKVEVKYVFDQVVFIAAMFLTGRTGLYCALVLIVFTLFVFAFRQNKVKQMMKLLFSIICFLSVGLLILKNVITEQQYTRFITRIITAITNFSEDQSVAQLSQMEIPSLTVETILGTGICRGYSPMGTLIWNDSGYVQQYAALGIIMAVFFYCLLASSFLKLLRFDLRIPKNINVVYFMFYIITIFVVEIKEPFIFKYIIPLYAILFICLYHRRLRNESKR